MKKGQAAPFDGQLFPTEAAILLGERAERCSFMLGQSTKNLRELCSVDIAQERSKHAVEMEAAQLREKMLIEHYRRGFWEHPLFVASLSVFATYAVLRLAKRLP